MARLAPVLTELDLPREELNAARLDGELYAIGDGFAPIDELEQARHRALSLAALTRPRFIAERMTAAWIHGATAHPPRLPQFCVSHEARTGGGGGRWHAVREVVISASEVDVFGPVSVTNVLRTAIDVLRWGDAFDDREAEIVHCLLERAGLSLSSCQQEVMSRHRLLGKGRALHRLGRMLAARS